MAGFALISLLVALLGFAFVQASTRQLLEEEARLDATQLSSDMSRNIPDLHDIAAGKAPSAATLDYLNNARRMGRVLSLRVYNTLGELQLQTDTRVDRPTPPQTVTDPSLAEAMREAMKGNAPETLIRTKADGANTIYYASAILPINDGFRTVGWFVADIDQTSRQAFFFSVTTRASLVIGFLLILAPILGFWYRARQRARFEQTIETLARHDQLTGLLNKQAFLKSVDVKLSRQQPQGYQSGLVMFNVGGLAATQQAHGHDAEDHAIRTIADRLFALASQHGEIAAAGRNTFALYIDTVTDPMSVLGLVKELAARLGEPVIWRDQTLQLQIHAGIALSSTDGSDATELARNAELAMLSALDQKAPGYGFFNPEIAKDTRRRIDVQRAVAAAAASHAFRLDFQPVYSIRTGELSSFEALIRLDDQELGAVSPAEFIPVAEQMGLINGIGAWAINEACRVAAEWPAHLIVAVNLSPFQFFSGTLITDVRNALADNRFPSYRLEVEITEGTLLNDSELVLSQLRVLRDMGVAVALDDFGTGYSSLSYLWKFPFSKLKIDRSFINALSENQSAKGVLRTIVKLGHNLGLTVTAEGIETTKQFTALRDLGCDLAQGYLLDRPARVADLAAIIMRNFANGLNRRLREPAAAETTETGKTAA